MANKDNECKDLNMGDKNFPGLSLLFEIQASLQETVFTKHGGTQFRDMNLREVVDFALKNKHALEDELSEMMDAIGGIDEGIGNAAWKWWKMDNAKTENMTINSLSESDRKELLMEYVDILHFFINFALLFGFSANEVANAYLAKNEENFKRQKNDY